QAEDGIRDFHVTGVQTCALPISGIAFKEQPPPKPMLTKLVDKLPSGDDWLYEKKYDGFRIIAVRSPRGVYLYSRSGKSMNHLFRSEERRVGKEWRYR